MLAAQVKLVPSSGGVFEVSVDGVPVYSKRQTGMFPDETGLVKKLRGD